MLLRNLYMTCNYAVIYKVLYCIKLYCSIMLHRKTSLIKVTEMNN